MPQVPGDATVLKRFFHNNFIFRRRSKRIAFLESVNFCKFSVSWWSRDHFSAPFIGLYLPNAWSETLQTSKRHTFRVSAFHRYHCFWGKTVPCRLCAGQSKCTIKRKKCCFFYLALPALQNSGIFYDSTRPHLHWRFSAKIMAIRHLYIDSI